ncbi:MAG: hypothetical protein AAFY36_15170 [Bacteroidota bacterium]
MVADILGGLMTVEAGWQLRLVFDSAALVLIWLVQLVIYPSFLYMDKQDFLVWHPIYTRKVTWVVMPIMLGQLVIYGVLLVNSPSPDLWMNTALVGLAWLITFVYAVPLHMTIEQANQPKRKAAKLVTINWYRTAIWTAIFLVDIWVLLIE